MQGLLMKAISITRKLYMCPEHKHIIPTKQPKIYMAICANCHVQTNLFSNILYDEPYVIRFLSEIVCFIFFDFPYRNLFRNDYMKFALYNAQPFASPPFGPPFIDYIVCAYS